MNPELARSRDENRFFSINIPYESQYPPHPSLRPFLQLEMAADPVKLPAIDCAVSSFVAEYTNLPPEISHIPCLHPTESTADKISALCWRVLDRARGEMGDDPALIRHLHDLAALGPRVIDDAKFPTLALQAMEGDLGRFKRNKYYKTQLPLGRLAALLSALETDPLYTVEYNQFVQNVSYGKTDNNIDYSTAISMLKKLVQALS